MHSMLLTSDKDPMGAAIIDYLAHGKASKLRVFSSMFDEDEIPRESIIPDFPRNALLGTESPSTQYRQNIGCWCRKWMPHLGFTGNG